MVKLHLFSGFEKQPLGIAVDTELGHLYDDGNNREALAEAAHRVGVDRRRMQTSRGGLAHFDLWGNALEMAKRLFPVVSRREIGQDMRRIGSGS